MKTNLSNNLPIYAVMASFLLIPVSATAAAIAVTLTGVVAMLWSDYGRSFEPLTARCEVIEFKAADKATDRALRAA
jgi:hypothetical protein